LNEGSGVSAIDYSGNGYLGTISNGSWSTILNTNILNFNGSSTNVNVGDLITLNNAAQFSISF